MILKSTKSSWFHNAKNSLWNSLTKNSSEVTITFSQFRSMAWVCGKTTSVIDLWCLKCTTTKTHLKRPIHGASQQDTSFRNCSSTFRYFNSQLIRCWDVCIYQTELVVNIIPGCWKFSNWDSWRRNLISFFNQTIFDTNLPFVCSIVTWDPVAWSVPVFTISLTETPRSWARNTTSPKSSLVNIFMQM